ncbi:hypothetical protein YC2023_040524 [Brassica napus]
MKIADKPSIYLQDPRETNRDGGFTKSPSRVESDRVRQHANHGSILNVISINNHIILLFFRRTRVTDSESSSVARALSNKKKAEAGNETTISIKLIILKRIFIDVDARIQSHIDPKGDKCNKELSTKNVPSNLGLKVEKKTKIALNQVYVPKLALKDSFIFRHHFKLTLLLMEVKGFPILKVYRVLFLQNPPSSPTLIAVKWASSWRRAAFLVDWHNFGYTLLALSLGRNNVFVSLYRW